MLRTGEEPILGYRLDKFLGRGQFGDVWQAQAPGGKLVALKFINIIGKQGLKEYKAIQKVKNIQHPHLMPIIAFWILDQEQNVLSDEVLEQLDLSSQGKQVDVRKTQMGEEPIPNTLVVAMLLGEASLYDHFEKYQEQGKPGIPVEELLDYMEEAAKGIDFLNRPCHDLGEGPVAIQHCDIKPHNMLLTGGAVQICDFGLARVLEDVRQTRSVAGTPAYIAPESISGRRPSATTDQYSLAITYYEMRTGDLPFANDDRTSQMAIMQAHIKGRLDFVLSPPAEAAVLRKATSIDPDQRYATSVQMVKALRKAHEQTLAPPSTSPSPDLTGTLGVEEPRDRRLSESGNSSGEFTRTEVTRTSQEASATINGAGIDGTLIVPMAPDASPQPAASSVPAASRPAPGQEPREQPESKSLLPLAMAALLLVALIGGGGFAWWFTSDPDPIVQGGGNGNGGHGTNQGGDPIPVSKQKIEFDPPDALVKINGESLRLQNGTLELEPPESNELYIEASHESGEWQLAETFSWSQLKALNFKVKLRRTAQSYVAKAWRELETTGFEQAVLDYTNALQLNRALASMPPPAWLEEQHGAWINNMALGPEGNWLATVGDGGENNAFAWQLNPAEPVKSTAFPLPGQEDLVEAVGINHDGRWLAIGGMSGRVQLWEIGHFEKGAITLTGIDADVLALSFDSSGNYLAASSNGDPVVVWNLQDMPQQTDPKFILESHIESVPALAFIPGTSQLITGGWDNKVKLWKLPAAELAGTEEIVPTDLEGAPESDIRMVAIDPKGDWLAAGSTESVVLWDLKNSAAGVELISRGISIEALVFSPDGKTLAAADAEGHIYTWSLAPREFPGEVTLLDAHQGEVMALAFSPDNRWLASGGGDRKIMLWDLTAPRLPPTELEGHTDKIRALRFSPQNHWLVSAGNDKQIGFWDYRRWAVIDRALRTFGVGPANTVAALPKGP